MKISQTNRLAVFVVLVLLFPLNACATTLSGDAIDGKVLEQGTNKPISQAIVIGRWDGSVPVIGHSQNVCVHVESTTTDAEGRYHLAGWSKPSTVGPVVGLGPVVVAYKAGYEDVDEKNDTIYLKRFIGTPKERLEYLQRTGGTCGSAGESKKNQLPMAKGIYEEARGIASNEEEHKVVNSLLFSVEILELGYEAAERRDIERSRTKK